MNQFEFSLATPEDDAALRRLLAATPLRGDISLIFAREPSYFAAAAVDGEFVQVVVARERQSQQLVGMGSRAISSCYVNGNLESVGYLSALRIDAEFQRRAGLLIRGYRYFHQLHRDGRAHYYLTTIAADNKSAIELLTSQRAGLPVYYPLGTYHTLTISPATQIKVRASESVFVRTAAEQDSGAIQQFLHQVGRSRQFFPYCTMSRAGQWLSRLLQFQPQNLLLAMDGDCIVGTLGVWDQHNFKQTIVAGYSSRLKLFRPLYNAAARLRGYPCLPRVGQEFRMRHAALFLVADDRPGIASALLATAVDRLRRERGAFLAVGLHERDPLLPVVRRYSGRKYTTHLYLVHWPDEVPDYQRLMSRVPYLELGCL